MIITRSPLRIPLAGGGTDLPSYYREHSGFCISVAIDKYVYITIHPRFCTQYLLKYSQLEEVDHVDEIRHPLFREAIRLVGLPAPFREINSMADIPGGTGLGSSASFTTALLKGLHVVKKSLVSPRDLAEQACHIEIDVLKEPVGKQDQYIAAFGGLACFRFLNNDQVEVSPLAVSVETMRDLEDNLMLFFTGTTRRASKTLQDQDAKSKQHEPEMIANLHVVKDIARRTREALERGNLQEFAELMNVHWDHKKRRSAHMSNQQIDEAYRVARDNGALGGKLVGAGGGGFLLFYTEAKTRLRHAMSAIGMEEVRFRFDFEGTKLMVQQ
jgi:D-glycero-alpha-D-manno-heptose-7-phosphate kinase